ncbi:MAG: efflux RND transporter periplasmic adaptor subunit [Planctomycetaceae bacterium]
MPCSIVLLVGLVATTPAAAAAAETFIVEGGVPRAAIVIADKPARMTRLAAKELQGCLRKMTGATLPIVTDRRAGTVAIFVGTSRHTEALGLATDGLEHGAFRMDSGADWLALLGPDKDFVPIEPWGRSRSADETARVNRGWDEITGDTFWNPGRSTRTAFQEARARIGAAEADKVAAEARHKVARAVLDRVATMLGYTEIRAPFAGTITRRSVDTGHFVQPASGADSTPLLEVARTDTVRIFVDVPELEAAKVDVGDPAEVRVQAAGTEVVHAAVTRTSGALLASNHSLRVEVDVPNTDRRLRSGMYATVVIRLEEHAEALVIPASAVVRDGKATFCCVVRDGTVQRRPIEVGMRSGGSVEVLSGLDEDAPIVIKQPELLRDGQDVRTVMAP